MQFRDLYKHTDKDNAIQLWARRLASVDKVVQGMQDNASQDAWALKYWQDVRRVLTRQLDSICQVNTKNLR